jgi:hypothetical protein
MKYDELCKERGENYRNPFDYPCASKLGMIHATGICTGVGRLRCGAGGGGGGGDAR